MRHIVNYSQQNVVTLESDLGSEATGFAAAHDELTHTDAKLDAQREAARRGVRGPTIGLVTGPYPVDRSGNEIDGSTDDPVWRYRIDVQINPSRG